MDLVRSLGDISASDLAEAGGKGSNLGEMIRAGLPVPPGFVVTTAAYRLFVSENRLAGDLARDPETTLASFNAGRIPDAVRDSVSAAYAEMGEGPVAVRSSATAEDLPDASFAGQQETYLYQEGMDAVLGSIRRCWASLWSSRAIAYRANRSGLPREVSLAVVVQRMVSATAAGVLFTANPVNGRRDQMVLNAAWGLGEAVVSGAVNPDQWVIDRETGRVLQETVSGKAVMAVRTPGGTGIAPVPETNRRLPSLDAASIEDLVTLGRRAAAHFGSPQDVEWAIDGDRLYLVQSRAITSLFPPVEPRGDEQGLRVYVCHTLIQGVTEPFTPMGLSILSEVQRVNGAINGAQLEPAGVAPIMKQAADRLFIDVTDTLRHSRLGPKLLFILSRVEPGTAAILKDLKDREQGLSFRKQGLPSAGMSFGQAMAVMGEMVRSMRDPDASRRKALAKIESDLEKVETEAKGLRDPGDGPAFIVGTIARLRDLLLPLFAPLGVGMMGEEGAAGLCAKWLGDPKDLLTAGRSLPNNPTTEMDLRLWEVSRVLLAEGAGPSTGHPAVQAFLREFGHRAVREMDIGAKRWRDEPGYVIAVLKTYMRSGEEADAGRHFKEGQVAAEAAVVSLIEQVRRKRGPFRAWVMRRMLFWMRALSGLRESPKFYTVRLLATLREVLQRCGDSLVGRGILEERDDVFWLTLDETDELLRPGAAGVAMRDAKAVVDGRKANYGRETQRRQVPRVVTSTGETFYAPPQASETAVLKGTPASPGTYEGVARVILDPAGARLEPGEVLVAPGTDPAWTPLFLSAGALVVETGGSMSHGAVVAREYGIPAIVGVAGATRLLAGRLRVRVDGESGAVAVLQ